MKKVLLLNLKIKLLDKKQLTISMDRLTRFKNTEIKYVRVFKDILIHNLISPKFNKRDLDLMPYDELKDYAQYIINESIKTLVPDCKYDLDINKKIRDYEVSVFKISLECEKLLDNNINYSGFINLIEKDSPKNLEWLKFLVHESDIKQKREKYSLIFPIEKVILAEGATEELLLPVFANHLGYVFEKNGVYIIPAGGKNQVVRAYYELSQSLKLPIYILLDKDGEENAKEISPRIRNQDKIHILECGEFEDLLSAQLINRTLNYELQNISVIDSSSEIDSVSHVKYLEEVFKNRGMHEFKKVEFAQMVKNNIESAHDFVPEVQIIIEEIKNMK